MAKAQSPVRLQKSLMDSAVTAGTLFNRSAAEQVEHWARIGRIMQNLIGVETLLDIMAGAKTINLEEAPQVRANPDDVFAEIERKREQGRLASSLLPGEVRYQSSKSHPGMLEQVSADGIVVGSFEGGEFNPKI